MLRRAFLGLLMLTLCAQADTTPQQIQIGGVWWYTDYAAALQLARQQHRPLWLHFGENPG